MRFMFIELKKKENSLFFQPLLYGMKYSIIWHGLSAEIIYPNEAGTNINQALGRQQFKRFEKVSPSLEGGHFFIGTLD